MNWVTRRFIGEQEREGDILLELTRWREREAVERQRNYAQLKNGLGKCKDLWVDDD